MDLNKEHVLTGLLYLTTCFQNGERTSFLNSRLVQNLVHQNEEMFGCKKLFMLQDSNLLF